jgi:hypothetical protein
MADINQGYGGRIQPKGSGIMKNFMDTVNSSTRASINGYKKIFNPGFSNSLNTQPTAYPNIKYPFEGQPK